MTSIITDVWSQLTSPQHRAGLHPIPGSIPLTIEAAVCPPLLYYVALLFLPPPTPPVPNAWVIALLRNSLALLAGFLFFRLPLAYHVPQSVGLTYQLGLVGIYGGTRGLDAFFISPYLFNHIPRRVRYEHADRPMLVAAEPPSKQRPWTDGGVPDPFVGKHEPNGDAASKQNGSVKPNHSKHAARRGSMAQQAGDYFSKVVTGPTPRPVYETAIAEKEWPHTFFDRASWALELELSMRGIGFTWTTADVRHTKKTWLPTIQNRLHSVLVHVAPILLISWLTIRTIYINHLQQYADLPWDQQPYYAFDNELALPQQLALTAALGAFLMAAFSLGHSLFCIILHPLAPSPLSFFPPLYTTPVWNITSVRKFWSFGWHRLFARLFYVWGILPGEWLERKLTGKRDDQPADVGKVLGGFGSSAFVHAFSVRCVLAGDWSLATGEAKFFTLNGVAVIMEGVVVRSVRAVRKRQGWERRMWYDDWIGRAWWIGVLLGSGRWFARGWLKAGLVREMAFM